MGLNLGSFIVNTPPRLGRYEILSRLGAGGMAEVFLARRTGAAGFEKKVALKRLNAHSGDNPAMIRGLINEAHLVARLSHPNLIQVFELEEIDGTYCMVMEYVDGATLEDVLNRCRFTGIPLPKGLLVHIIMEVCSGLHYAHQARSDDGEPLHLIHRDIKPSNIMITTAGRVKLMDFGIARSTSNPYQTTHTSVKGTLCYMSPEQLAGENPLEPTSDLFSLGVVLYEMATLERLFDDTNLIKLAADIQRGLQEPAAERLRGVFPELVPIVERLLTCDPRDRYPDAQSLMIALRPLSFQAGPLELSYFLGDLRIGESSADPSAETTFHSDAPPTPITPPTVDRPASLEHGSALEHGKTVSSAGRSNSHAAIGREAEAPAPGALVPARSDADGENDDNLKGSESFSDEGLDVVGARRGMNSRVWTGLAFGLIALVIVLWVAVRMRSPLEPVSKPSTGTVELSALKTGADVHRAPTGSGDEAGEDGGSVGTPAAGPVIGGEASSGHPVSAGDRGGVGRKTRERGQRGSASPAVRDKRARERKPASAAVDPVHERRGGNERSPGKGGTSGQGGAVRSVGRSQVPPLSAEDAESREADNEVRAEKGILVISSLPYAQVIVDGREVGEGLVELKVPAGVHEIKLVRPEETKVFEVNLAPGERLVRAWSFADRAWIEE